MGRSTGSISSNLHPGIWYTVNAYTVGTTWKVKHRNTDPLRAFFHKQALVQIVPPHMSRYLDSHKPLTKTSHKTSRKPHTRPQHLSQTLTRVLNPLKRATGRVGACIPSSFTPPSHRLILDPTAHPPYQRVDDITFKVCHTRQKEHRSQGAADIDRATSPMR